MDRWRAYAEISAAALAFLAAVLLGLWLGQWLDAQLRTGGLMTIAMLFLGLLAAVVNLLRIVGRMNAPRRDE